MIKKIILMISIIGIVIVSTYYNREKIVVIFHHEEPIFIDEINFEEERIQIFYDADGEPSYYYQDEKGNKYSQSQMKNSEGTKVLYIDYFSSKAIKQDEVLLEPDFIVEGIESDISVYILDSQKEIKINQINSSDDYTIMLCNTLKKGWCSEKISLDLLRLKEMIETWKLCEDPVDNMIKEGIQCLSIRENWETYVAAGGFTTFSGWDFRLLQLDEGAYVQISGNQTETYFLEEEQVKAFYELLGL